MCTKCVYGQNGVAGSPKCMFLAEYSLLIMFEAYPASKCTTLRMYTCVCAGLVAFSSPSTALGSLKEEERKKKEDEQFAWATILVYHFRNV